MVGAGAARANPGGFPDPAAPAYLAARTRNADRAPAGGQLSEVTTAMPPWGAYRGGRLFRLLLGAARRVPRTVGVRQLAFLLRRLARGVATDPVDVTHWGHRLRLRTRGNISEATFLFMPGRWDWRERRYLQAELRPGAILVDVGANAGGYVWWLLHLFGRDCTILAVEPEPGLHARLVFNLRTNGCDNVTVLRMAVGTEPGTGWLRLGTSNLGENRLVAAAEGTGAGAGVAVPVRPLPELVAEATLPRVDALKIDVEGLEAAILADYFDRAPEALWPGILLVERQSTGEHGALLRRLAGLGYREELTTGLNVLLRRR
jgi:FkbM family methyltransferase